MKTPFFITGLPRTRSAWLANLFTTDSTVCFHEPRQTVTELITAHPWLRIGVADATLPLKYNALADRYPAAPWLYVEREPAEAMRSFVRFTREHVKLLHRDVQRFWTAHKAASALLKGERVLRVQFADLEQPDVIARAWAHLLPEVQLNALRLAMLRNLKIEQRIAGRIREVLPV